MRRRRPRSRRGSSPGSPRANPRGDRRCLSGEPTRKRRLVFVDKPERTQTQILMGDIGSHPRDADHIPLHVGDHDLRRHVHLANDARHPIGARLVVRRVRALPYDAARRLQHVDLPRRQGCRGVHRTRARAARHVAREGNPPKELAFAQELPLRSHAFDIDTAQKRVHQQLDVDLFDLPADYHTKYLDHVQAVTLDPPTRPFVVASRAKTWSWPSWARTPKSAKQSPAPSPASPKSKSSPTTRNKENHSTGSLGVKPPCANQK